MHYPFLQGMPLRDLLLGDQPHDLSSIMHEVCVVLSKIAAHTFPHTGFFDFRDCDNQTSRKGEFFNKDLVILPSDGDASNDWLAFAKDCAKNETVESILTPQTIKQVESCLDKYGHLFPEQTERHLVHGDFDPANLLVDQVDGRWTISGVLDWEFAFAGSTLCDVANMLRYAHKMPTEFQTAFLRGLGDGGVSLPQNWQITVNLLNLASLLECLTRSDPKTRPVQCADIRELIEHILLELGTSVQ